MSRKILSNFSYFMYGGEYKNCYLEAGEYENNHRLALLVESPVEGPIAKVTVNIPDVELKDDEIILDEVGDADFNYQNMKRLGVIVDKVGYVKSGFKEFAVCTINTELLNVTR